jgi:hypothetical protein
MIWFSPWIRFLTSKGSGSSDALGFGNSTDWVSTASAPDDLTVDSMVHPTLIFKSYKDAPKELLQHHMNWHFRINSAVHLTLVFELHSTAPGGCSSAPDGLMGRRCIDWVTWCNGYISVNEWPDDSTLSQGEPSVHPTVLLFKETFPMASLPC